MKSARSSFFIVIFYWVASLYSAGLVAQETWAFEQVSPAIYRLDEPVIQRFSATATPQSAQTEQKLTTIMVQVLPSTAAFIESYLCVNDSQNCVPIRGGRLYTQAFNQYSAQSPVLVVHRVRGWNGTLPPLFIKTQLNLWWG